MIENISESEVEKKMVEEYKVIPVGRAKDLRGQKFGRLTVVDRVEKPEGLKNHCAYWLCKCDCGEENVVASLSLVSRATQSCGCLRSEAVSESNTKDLTGRVFGQLKAVRLTDRRANSGKRIWECECGCGKTTFVISSSLVEGHTRSCGHLDSDGQELGTKVGMLDMKLYSNSTSGHKGVTWRKDKFKWQAQIGFQRKIIHLGYFSDIQDAIDARKEAEEFYFKPVLEHFEDRR